MINRSTKKKACQKDFSSPVPDKIQTYIMDIFNQPSSRDRWGAAVYYHGMLMNHYLKNCPAGRSWLSAGSGKLKNIVKKRNDNLS